MAKTLDFAETSPGKWGLIEKPKGEVYRGPSGRSEPDHLRKAEKKLGFVAFYVLGEQNTNNIRVGTATDLQNIFQQAQTWNCRNIVVHGVMWARTRIYANNLEAAVERQLGPYNIRGKWFEMNPEMVINTVELCAGNIRAQIFNDRRRYELYESDIENERKQKGLLNRARPMLAAPKRTAEIIPMPSAERTRR